MCKYVPASACQLTRVEFWTNDVTTDVDVYVYDTFSGGTLSTLMGQQLNSSYGEVGYHSVALPSPISCSAGNDVYVAVAFTNQTNGWPVVADNAAGSTIESNKTYLSSNGSGWTEMGLGYGVDIAIRLRTTTSTGSPAIDVVPDTLKFGQVQVSSDSSQALRVKNTGTDTLRVTDINSSDPAVAVSDTAFKVAPSGSTNVTVTFTPAAVQSYSEILSILHNAKGTTVVPVLGQGVSTGAPAISVVPDTLKYGQVTVSSDSSQSLRVKNPGTDTLRVTDINSSDPVVTVSDTAFNVAPSDSQAVTVTFTPAAAQTYSEAVIIQHNAKGTTVVPVLGEGIGASAPAITVSPDTLNYGQVPVGADSSMAMRIKSTGGDTLRVYDINPSAGVLSLSDTAFVLAPSESTDVTVTFAPGAVQSYSETLTILHNAAKGSTIIPVTGQGIAGLDLVIAAGDIQFDPAVPVMGDTVSIEARVHNVTPKGMLAAVDSVVVRFYDGNPDGAGIQIGADQIILTIEPDSSETAQVSWPTQGLAGGHQIHVLVDPDDHIMESSEGNNRAQKAITVHTMPVVQSVVLSDPSPTAAGGLDLTFNFDRAMDTAVSPTATYGILSPYNQNAIVANPGWSADSTTWFGQTTIVAAKGDGLNTLRIQGAQDPLGQAMEADTSWTFFVDTVVPSSQASSPAYSGATSFPVNWSGSDPAPSSGIASYSVWVLVDGLFPTQWLTDTTDTTAAYSGSNGHSYSFYSTTKDAAGNEEAVPGTPDCTTHVDTDPPAIPALLSPACSCFVSDNTPTVTWSQVAKGSPVTYHLQVALNAGCADPVVDTSGLSDTSFTITTPLADQPHFWRVQAVDMAQNSSGFQTTPFMLTVDTQIPLIAETTVWPDTGFSGPFTVGANIGDPAGIAMALLWYRNDLDT
ncbi:choice-of-anchor D domain-containing protein, partial [Candidatus Zixiibacteriota bacterium]